MEKGALITNCSLKELNTWQCGGRCLWLAAPASASEAVSLIEEARGSSTRLYTLGGGSNILVQDGLLNAGVISSAALDSLDIREAGGAVSVEAGAGVQVRKMLALALERGLGGLAFHTGHDRRRSIRQRGGGGRELRPSCRVDRDGVARRGAAPLAERGFVLAIQGIALERAASSHNEGVVPSIL